MLSAFICLFTSTHTDTQNNIIFFQRNSKVLSKVRDADDTNILMEHR